MKTTIKIILLIIICTLLINNAEGQNLIPNPSFEDTVSCPPGWTQIEFATGWINPNGYSPDYFNSCVPDTGCCNIFSVPNNSYGNQNARTGVAYGGIFMPITSGNSLREYVQIQLIDTLVTGVEYLVKFYVSLADSSEYSVNSLGAYLSNNAISSPSLNVFNVTPQVVNNGGVTPLTNKNIWYEISDTITAVGGEEYITIGNFEFDSVRDTTAVSGGIVSGESYYYIDDVSVETKPTSINEIDIDNILNVYPNPVNNMLNIKLNKTGEYSAQLFDMLGNIMSQKRMIKDGDSFSTDSYSNGMYFIRLSDENKILKTIKLIINQ